MREKRRGGNMINIKIVSRLIGFKLGNGRTKFKSLCWDIL